MVGIKFTKKIRQIYAPDFCTLALILINSFFKIKKFPGGLMESVEPMNFLPGFHLEGYPNR